MMRSVSLRLPRSPGKTLNIVSELELMPVSLFEALPQEFHSVNLLCHHFVAAPRGREA